MVVAFEGWNDAADASSVAPTNLARAWQAVPFAEIDPEEFFDFTEARPELTVVEGLVRGRSPGPPPSSRLPPARSTSSSPVGRSPSCAGAAYCDAFVELAGAPGRQGRHPRRLSRRGRALAARPARRHRQRCRVCWTSRAWPSRSTRGRPASSACSAWRSPRPASRRSRSGRKRARRLDFRSSAKAALALAEATTRLVGRHADLAELTREALEYERQMDELVGEDETVAATSRGSPTKTPLSRTPRSRSSPTRSSATCATNPPG